MVKVSITGLKELEARLKKAPQLKNQVDDAVKIAAKTYVTKAKQSATSQFGDKGVLNTGIGWVPLAPLAAKVFSDANYSAYLEWGTVTHVSVPAELKDYAIQFKGRGIRKTGGIIPRPYFFIHQNVIQEMLRKDIIQVLEGI